MKVREVMTHSTAICRATDGLDIAMRRMQDRNCGCIVVVDDREHPIGIVTDRDAGLAALRTLQPLHLLRVSDAMTSPVTNCGPGDPVAQAEETMSRLGVRRLPVVDAGGKLVGILALDDLARRTAKDRDLFAPQVRADEVGKTLADVTRPRIIVDSSTNS